MASNYDIAQTLLDAISSNPDLLGTFLEHPYTAVQEATGAEEKLDRTDMSEVVTTAAGLASGQDFDASNIAGLASAFLGASDNSVHSLVGSLFGGGQTAQAAPAAAPAAEQATSTDGGLDLGSLVSFVGIASQLMGGGSSTGGFDLSDGIGLDDIVGLIGLTSGASTQQQAAPAQTATTTTAEKVEKVANNGIFQFLINIVMGLFGVKTGDEVDEL